MVIESTTWNTFILPCTKRPRYRTQNCFGRQACDFKPTTNSDGNNINTYQNQHLHNLQRWYKQQPMRYKKHARLGPMENSKENWLLTPWNEGLVSGSVGGLVLVASRWNCVGKKGCATWLRKWVKDMFRCNTNGQLGTTITHYRSLWFHHGSSQLYTTCLCFCSSNADTFAKNVSQLGSSAML